MGLIALQALPREEEPQISVPLVDIMAPTNGYKADDAVELVTRPLEDLIKAVNGVEHVYSQTQDDNVVVNRPLLRRHAAGQCRAARARQDSAPISPISPRAFANR